jgi:hypothetical protein
MGIEYYDNKVQVSHCLNKKECKEIDGYLLKNPQSVLRLYWFENDNDLLFLKNISNVKKIQIDYSSITSIDVLSAFPEMELLNIDEIDGNLDITAIESLKKLKVLNINLRKSTRQIDFSFISEIPDLEEFYFYGKCKKGSLDISKLKNLKIFAPQMKFVSLKEMSQLKHLKVLNIFNQNVDTLEGLDKIISLEKIHLSTIRIANQDILEPVFRLPMLRTLGLSYIKEIHDFQFIKTKSSLKELVLWTLNGLISYSGIENLEKLENLSFCGEHANANGIDFSSIEKLSTLKQLKIKPGKISEATRKKISMLIEHVENYNKI